jgi:hypothetical protein
MGIVIILWYNLAWNEVNRRFEDCGTGSNKLMLLILAESYGKKLKISILIAYSLAYALNGDSLLVR